MKGKKISIDETLTLMEDFNKDKIRWHYHLFTPGCSLKTTQSKYAVYLESENGIYLAEIDNVREIISNIKGMEQLLYEQLKLTK